MSCLEAVGWGLFPARRGQEGRARRWHVGSRARQKALRRRHGHGHRPETPERAGVKIELQRGRVPVPAGSGSRRRATRCARAGSRCFARDLCTWARTTKVQLLEQKPNPRSCWVWSRSAIFPLPLKSRTFFFFKWVKIFVVSSQMGFPDLDLAWKRGETSCSCAFIQGCCRQVKHRWWVQASGEAGCTAAWSHSSQLGDSEPGRSPLL